MTTDFTPGMNTSWERWAKRSAAPSWVYVGVILLLGACSRGGATRQDTTGAARQDTTGAATSIDTAPAAAPAAQGTMPAQKSPSAVIPDSPSGKVAPTRRRPEPAVSSTIIGRDSVINFPRRTLPLAKPKTP